MQQSKENVDSSQQCHDNGQQTPPPYNIEEEASSEVSTEGSIPIQSVDTLRPIIQQVCMMEPEDQLRFVSEVFAAYCLRQNVTVPEDFLQVSVKGMTQLQIAKRSNILYALAKGLGTQRSDGSDSLFPCKQVVAGLLEHCVNFFTASYGDQVSVMTLI